MGLAYNSEVYIIIMVGHGCVQADMVPKKELKVLHLDLQATGSKLLGTLSVD